MRKMRLGLSHPLSVGSRPVSMKKPHNIGRRGFLAEDMGLEHMITYSNINVLSVLCDILCDIYKFSLIRDSKYSSILLSTFTLSSLNVL